MTNSQSPNVRANPAGEHENPALPLDRRYWCALVLIAALIVFHQLLLQPALSRLTSDAPVINVAGRQRMLSQKLSKAALALVAAPNEDEQQARRQELQVILQEWTRAHRGLQLGDVEQHLPGKNSGEILAAFVDLEPHFTEIVGAAEDLLSTFRDAETDTSPTRTEAIRRILQHEAEFLTRMHAIVGLYEAEARGHISQLQTLGVVIMITILGTLLIVQFAVVRPAVQWVGREFEQSEAQYRRLVESMNDGLVVHDAQQRVQFVNRRFCEIVGYSAEQLLGGPASIFVADGDRRRYDELAYLPDGNAQPVEVALRHHDGQLIDVMVSPQPLFDLHNHSQGFLLVMTDITARRQAEQRNRELADQLAHADRLKSMGELAAGLAHEINQPLGAIANYAEGGLATLAANPDAETSLQVPLQRILRAAIRGGEIIRRARSFSQLRPHEIAQTQINDLVAEVEQMCLTEARKRGVDVRLDLDPTLLPVPVDAIQIQQVLANLIQNAFGALETTPEYRRRLTLRTRPSTDGGVELSVIDNGCGVAVEHIERVFQPFFTTRKEGTGMGLAIVRGIIESHGGTIVMERNTEGGSTFRCTLPADCESLRRQAPEQIVTEAAPRSMVSE